MEEWLASVAVSFAALFLVVEPLGLVPIFLSLTRGRSADEVVRIANRATLIGALVLVAFTLGGRYLLDVLGIGLDGFRVAGGLLLLMTAVEMLRGKGADDNRCRCSPLELAAGAERSDVAVIPLAMPLLTGPGAMATVLVAQDGGGLEATAAVLVAIALTYFASWLVLRAAAALHKRLGASTLGVTQRIFRLFLGALRAVPGVASADVDLAGACAIVRHDPSRTTSADLADAVERAGYDVRRTTA
jgi:multiple antibiotic resistance protein